MDLGIVDSFDLSKLRKIVTSELVVSVKMFVGMDFDIEVGDEGLITSTDVLKRSDVSLVDSSDI